MEKKLDAHGSLKEKRVKVKGFLNIPIEIQNINI